MRIQTISGRDVNYDTGEIFPKPLKDDDGHYIALMIETPIGASELTRFEVNDCDHFRSEDEKSWAEGMRDSICQQVQEWLALKNQDIIDFAVRRGYTDAYGKTTPSPFIPQKEIQYFVERRVQVYMIENPNPEKETDMGKTTIVME